ncbi:unnamed protein product [Diabrotica balteata]|uniref:Protein TsetseEP domain-containing protein n=1 Tax=Diabrotica balteata TaxID=107213 RepID=A0A9N9TA89_DIABA|nr:unnamed protein product [Diabrotica balteata]
MAKIVLFFCAIILASAVALPSKSDDENLIDIVKKVVHKIEDLLDKVFADGPNFIDTFADKYDEDLTKVLDYTRTVLTKLVEALKPLVDNIAAQSTDAGKKLVSCIEQHESDIVDIRVTFVEGAGKCVKDSLVALVKTVAPVLKDLSGVHDQAKEAANEIDQCQGNDAQTLLCVVQVASDLIKVLTEIPDAVKGDIQPVIDAAKAIASSGKQCVVDQIQPFYVNAGNLLGEVVSCAAA